MRRLAATILLLLVHGTASAYTLTVTAEHGSVRFDPDQAEYDAGSEVVVIPTPDPGYCFDRWSGSVSTKQVAVRIVVTGNKSLTAHFAQWFPPAGIPEPPFGIEDVCPDIPDQWTSENTSFWYIDNTDGSATDTVQAGEANPRHGYPGKPRLTIPIYPTITPGMVMIVAAGEYTPSKLWISGTGATAESPAFIRGLDPENPPTIKTSIQFAYADEAKYTIIEHLKFEGAGVYVNSAASKPLKTAHHISIRNCEFDGNGADVGCIDIQGYYSQPSEYIVVYNNLIHDYGDWLADFDQDCHGVTVQANAGHVWVLDNEIYHCSGDAFQALWRLTTSAKPHHIYCGRNVGYRNKQTAFWTKSAADVVFSENVAFDTRPVGENPSSPGDGIGVQYGPERVWVLFNTIFDCDNGIRLSADDATLGVNDNIYIVGNLIYDIHHSTMDRTGTYPVAWNPDDRFHPGVGITIWHSQSTKYVVGNTIYDADGGIFSIRQTNPTVIVNNIVGNLISGGLHVWIPDSTVASLSSMSNMLFDETASINWGGTVYSGVAAFQAGTGKGADCIEADPSFVGATNFNLANGSPAIGAAYASDVYDTFNSLYGIDIKKDIDGRTRPMGGSWDIGAFERARGKFILQIKK
jgi:hypothetical protein